MTPSEAAALLEIAPDSTPEQIEERFLDLRRKLEDKIAKAPTPGLQAKYRASLTEITTAFETLTLAADSSTLPVLKRAATAASGTAAKDSTSVSGTAIQPHRPDTTPSLAPAKKKTSGNKEFAIVAAIAIALLGGGGWFVMKTRAEAAEKARQEVLAKAEAARLDAETKAEAARKAEEARLATELGQARIAKLNASIKATLAEARANWDAIERHAQSGTALLSEMKGDLRSGDKLAPARLTELAAKLEAHRAFMDWQQSYLTSHQAKTLLAKSDALLSAGAVDEAEKTSRELVDAIADARKEIAAREAESKNLSGSLKIESDPTGLTWEITDSFGHTATGVTPGEAGQVAYGSVRYVVRRSGWPDKTGEIRLLRSTPAKITAEFLPGAVTIESIPAGALVSLEGKMLGTTPLTLGKEIPGKKTYRVFLVGHEPAQGTTEIVEKETASIRLKLKESAPTTSGSIETPTVAAWRTPSDANEKFDYRESDGVKYILVSTLRSLETNRQFQDNVAIVQKQLAQAKSLKAQIAASATPEEAESLKKYLQDTEKSLEANNTLMAKTYGYTVLRRYYRETIKSLPDDATVILESKLFMSVPDDEFPKSTANRTE